MTGTTLDELTDRAGEAIRINWESVQADRSPTSMLREIEVELPPEDIWGWTVAG